MTSNLSEGSCYFKPNIRDFKLLRRQEALSKIFRQQFKENIYCPVFFFVVWKFTSRGTSRLNTEFKYTGQTGKKLELQFCWGDCQLNTQLITYWHLSWEISPAKLQQSFRNTLWDLFFFKIPKNITKRKNESLNQDTKKTKRSEKTKRKEVTMRKAESPTALSSQTERREGLMCFRILVLSWCCLWDTVHCQTFTPSSLILTIICKAAWFSSSISR